MLNLLSDLLETDNFALEVASLILELFHLSLEFDGDLTDLRVELLDLNSMLSNDVSIQILKHFDLRLILGDKFVIFFINDLLLGDNLFSWTLLNLSLLLLVDEINLLDFLTSFGVLFLKINVLRSQIFNGLFELFLMLLHLEVKLLSLG